MDQVPYLSLLIAACAVTAWCVVVSRRSLYAPAAVLLMWLTASNLIRIPVQRFVLNPARVALGAEPPYPWPMRGWYFVELATRIAAPFAVTAAALFIFVRRSPWPVALGWVAASAYLCAMYPELRRAPQAWVEAWIGLACWVVSVGAGWLGHFRRRVDIRECYVPMALILAADAAILFVVQFGRYPQRDWGPSRFVQGTIFAALLLYQLWILGRAQRSWSG